MIDQFCSENIFNTEIVDSTIVDNSFLAQRFKLADGAYSIIDLNSKKMLIIKFKDKTNIGPHYFLKKILKEDGDLFFFPEKKHVLKPNEKQVQAYEHRSEMLLKGMIATFEFKKGIMKNLLVNILPNGQPHKFYGIDFKAFRKTLAFDVDYSQKKPSKFFFKSLSAEKKIEFIATTFIPKTANWSGENYYSWRCKGSANDINSCEVYFPRYIQEDKWPYPSKKLTGTFKKYSRNFKEGKKNDKELAFRINGEVVKITHFTAGIKNGWYLHFKKNHGLALLKYKYKTSHESIVKAVFYKDGEVIHNPFILASQPKLF
jgi:hypothetical protein